MDKLLNFARLGLLTFLVSAVSACGGVASGDRSSSSSSGHSSSSSSSTSSASSSGDSTPVCPVPGSASSSSSSSSGWANLTVDEFCGSSVGTNFGTHFQLESSANGRLDFPEIDPAFAHDRASGRVLLSYANSTGNTVPMKLWLGSPLKAIDLAFPPTDGWGILGFNLQGAHQFSITSAGDNGSIDIQNASYTWRTTWGFDNLLIIGSCPGHPLPGIGDAEPQAPTARLMARSGPCGTFTTYRVTARVAESVEFNAILATDPNIEPLSYFWDFQDGHTAEGEQVAHAFTDAGVYFVELTVQDSSGFSDKERMTIDIKQYDPANSPPVAVITANRTNLLWPYTSTTLWGDVSYDQDGDPIARVWYNGFTEEVVYGPEIDLELSDFPASSQTITLGVSDGRGGTDMEERQVTVAEYPGADCVVTYHSNAYPTFSMDVKLYNNTQTPMQGWQATWRTEAPLNSLTKPLNGLYTLTVDGSQEFTVSGDTIAEHSWVSIRLSGRSDAELQDINFQPQNGMTCIENMPPRLNQKPVTRITATTQSGDAPLTVYFSAEDSYDPEGDAIEGYLWDFGDGTHAFGPSVSHTYRATGFYDVRLKISESPLRTLSDWEEGVYGSALSGVTVRGEQNIGCRGRISPANQAQDEYYVDVWYWFKAFEEDVTEPVHLNSGQVNLAQPIRVKQADAEAEIELNTPSDAIDFSINKLLNPGATVNVRMLAEIDDIEQMYFTGCTFE